MKKITPIFLIICASLFSVQSRAQDQTITGGSLLINAGVGYGYDYGYSLADFYPAVMVSGDYGLNVKAGPGTIGIGGIVGLKFGSYSNSYYSYGTPYSYSYTDNYSAVIIAVRGTYHWTPPGAKNLDLYGGIPIGVRLDHYTEYYPYYSAYYNAILPGESSGSQTYPFLGLFVGAAYYFTKGFGVYAELGYDVSAFTVGVSFKVK